MSTASSRRADPPPAHPVQAAAPSSPPPAPESSATVVPWPGRTHGTAGAARPADLSLPDASVRIETANMGDWLDILDIVARHFPFADELELRYYLCNQSSWFHVARVGGALAGFAHLQPRLEERTLWLNMLVVDGPYRRFGCSRRLLAHAEELAYRAGFTSIGLRVMASNERAVRLYLEQGYVDVKQSYDREKGGHFRVMSKALATPPGTEVAAQDPNFQPDTGWRRWRNQLNYLVRIGSQSPLRGR
jgi:GNAT superfamily N-acetyltransferase